MKFNKYTGKNLSKNGNSLCPGDYVCVIGGNKTLMVYRAVPFNKNIVNPIIFRVRKDDVIME